MVPFHDFVGVNIAPVSKKTAVKGKNSNSNQRATKHAYDLLLPSNILERAKLKFLFILCIWRNNIEYSVEALNCGLIKAKNALM